MDGAENRCVFRKGHIDKYESIGNKLLRSHFASSIFIRFSFVMLRLLSSFAIIHRSGSVCVRSSKNNDAEFICCKMITSQIVRCAPFVQRVSTSGIRSDLMLSDQRSQVLAALSVSLGSLVVGFTSGYTSPAIPSMKDPHYKTFSMSIEQVITTPSPASRCKRTILKFVVSQ